MRHRIPKHYTLLISCTGRAPLTLSFQPWVVFSAMVVAIALPTLSIGKLIASYHSRNTDLSERNASLSRQATDILEQVEDLEAQVQTLQQRAGLPDDEAAEKRRAIAPSQGGEEIAVDPDLLFDEAKIRLSGLTESLSGDVQPALEKTLEREAALPHGVPLKVTYEQSSGFGLRRNPFGGRSYELHNGLDFKAAYGTAIYATAPGIVTVAEFSGGFGNHVVVDHGYGYRTLYAHLSKIDVTTGMRIERDRIVGYLGNTGRSSGPHLHYSVYYQNQPIDPTDYLDE